MESYYSVTGIGREDYGHW